jgi:hypothetical protein
MASTPIARELEGVMLVLGIGMVVGYLVGVFASSNIVLPLGWAWPMARRLEQAGRLIQPIPIVTFLAPALSWSFVILIVGAALYWFSANLITGYAVGLPFGFIPVFKLVNQPNEDMVKDFLDAYGAFIRQPDPASNAGQSANAAR